MSKIFTNKKNYLFLSLFAMLMLSSCDGNKIDISGSVQGVWKTDWDEKDIEGDIDDIQSSETIAFLNDSEAGTGGKFRQVYLGTAEYEGSGIDQRVAFAVVTTGDWHVVDVNGIKMTYNLDNTSISVANPNALTDKATLTRMLLTGDWNAPVSATITSNESDKLSPSLEEAVKQQLNTYFRNQFRDINKEKAGLNNVVIDGKMLTAKGNGGGLMSFSGSDITYYKSDIDVQTLNSQVQAAQVQGQGVLPESSVASLSSIKNNSSAPTPAGLANYDWLSTRYANHSDLAGKSGSQLRIMRNYIYARHGYKFKSADLQRYFAQYPWYTPMYSDVSHQLNKIEKSNVQMIQSYE